MSYLAIDVETANESVSSICQIGLAEYVGATLTYERNFYVNPEVAFNRVNIGIHGIDESKVASAPTFAAIWGALSALLAGRIVCSHTAFDQAAIRQACEKYHLSQSDCIWLDTASVARRAWPQFSHRGYGLESLAEFLGYKFEHHDALEDAKAAARILQAAVEQTGLGLDDWIRCVERPLDPAYRVIARKGSPDGALRGEVVVFTGELTLSRREAADLAAGAGCTVKDNVTSAITLLVVGNQDPTKLAGHEKSSKERKAEELLLKGKRLRILHERDFLGLLGLEYQTSDSPATASSLVSSAAKE